MGPLIMRKFKQEGDVELVSLGIFFSLPFRSEMSTQWVMIFCFTSDRISTPTAAYQSSYATTSKLHHSQHDNDNDTSRPATSSDAPRASNALETLHGHTRARRERCWSIYRRVTRGRRWRR